MISSKMWKAIGVAGAALTSALLLGFLGFIPLAADTNLFQTGITPGLVFGIWMGAVSVAIYKNKI